MTDPMEVVATLCERYQTAVSANDSAAYGRLFAADAIRVRRRAGNPNTDRTKSRKANKGTTTSRRGTFNPGR
jgi:hypothetical protein